MYLLQLIGRWIVNIAVVGVPILAIYGVLIIMSGGADAFHIGLSVVWIIGVSIPYVALIRHYAAQIRKNGGK